MCVCDFSVSSVMVIFPTCPTVSAAKRVCSCPVGAHQLHGIVCKSGCGVDQRPSALARCLANLTTTHTGAKLHIEQTIPGLPREPQPGAQPEGARMDIVFNLRGHTYYIDKAVVTPFSSNAGLISAASARTSHMAKREEKEQFDRYPRINLVQSNLETTERPSYHALTASGTLWPLSRPHCAAASPNNNSEPSTRDSRLLFLTTPHAFCHGPHHAQKFTSRCGARSTFFFFHGRPLPVAAVNTL